jgi:hypothetical protein
MITKPAYRGWPQTISQLPVPPTAAARCGAIITFIALTLILTTSSAMGSPSLGPSLTGASVETGDGSEALRAPLQQSSTDATDLEPPTSSGGTSEASRMAAVTAVVNRQGVQGPLNLRRLSAVEVPNLMTEPELVVDARAKRVAEAEAAEAEIALSVQATVEAQAAEAAKVANLAAIEDAESAAASATAAAIATETARNSAADAAAALLAKQEAEVRAAEFAATRNVEAPVPAEVVTDSTSPDRMSFLMIALTPMLGGVLGLRIWRSRKEPFVLKANPIPARSSALA